MLQNLQPKKKSFGEVGGNNNNNRIKEKYNENVKPPLRFSAGREEEINTMNMHTLISHIHPCLMLISNN